jgi:protein-S-isoprenylcysteine O-methyltransferase Ste14
MHSLRQLLTPLVAGCWLALGAFWLLAAVYFALRTPTTATRRLALFARTLFPEPWLLLAIPVAAVVLPLVPAAVWARLTVEVGALQVVGAALLVASTLLALWARVALGRMWAGRPMTLEGHELRTDGPYGLVRHPIYSGIAGMILGTALILGFGKLLPILLCTAAIVAWRIRTEERLMVATFGEQYLRYRRRVPALVPSPVRLRHAGA